MRRYASTINFSKSVMGDVSPTPPLGVLPTSMPQPPQKTLYRECLLREWAQDVYDDFLSEKSPDKRRQIFMENGVPSKLIPVAIELFS
nr:MAG TPA: hypothetical protein [Caudoviricetes sp.]